MTQPFQLPLFAPASSWRMPHEFPRFDPSEPLAIDLETWDPHLKERGASWRYGKGHIAGIALADKDRQFYFPIRHRCGTNLPATSVLDWLAEILAEQAGPLVFANAAYDLGWLHHEQVLPDIRQLPQIRDIQIMEALLIEEHPLGYRLDELARRYLGKHKDETLLNEASRQYEVNAKGGLHQLPPEYVGPYAEQDARLTFDIHTLQMPRLVKEDLIKVFQTECQLTPILVEMTRQGIPFDCAKAEQLNLSLRNEEKQITDKLGFDIWSTEQVAKALRQAGFPVPKTDKGNDSCNKQVLQELCLPPDCADTDNLPLQITQARQLNRLRQTFIEDALKWVTNGRLHPEYIQLARDEGGTRSGRLAARNPNIQQVPKRSEVGKQIRTLYTAQDGALWAKLDYSSQEPRMQLHYALLMGLAGAQEVRAAFLSGKKLYSWMEENIAGISYDDAKMLVLGRSYGMGKKSMAQNLNITVEAAEQLLERFDAGVPYISQLAQMCASRAEEQGEIRTVLGRKRRFLYWEPADKSDERPKAVFGLNASKERWKNRPLRRAYTNKAFNALIQGSAADQTKSAINLIWEMTGRIPLSQVHDELNYQLAEPGEAEKLVWLMENAIPNLRMEFKADAEIGKTWR